MINMPELILFSLILMRITGFVAFSPLFGRNNIPALVKAGFIMVLSISAFSSSQMRGVEFVMNHSVVYGIYLLKELFVGFVLGYVMQLFLMLTTYGGHIISFNMGLSMAEVYDPLTNSQTGVVGSALSTMFMLLFLTVDGHLALIQILIKSELIIPYSQVIIQPGIATAVLDIFFMCMILAFKLGISVMAMELITEVGAGILMKMIPQINIFVINIQLKIVMGLFLLLLLNNPIGEFFLDVIDTMLQNMQEILTLM